MQQQQQNKRKTAAPPEVGVIQSIKVDIDIVDNNTGQIPGVNENPREMTEMEFKKLKKSLQRDAGYTAISELRLFPLGDRWVTIGGNMRLSKAARNYHPGAGQGPGVYRSSYKNAMRLARTEINMAYQAADNERWTKTWWVRGIEIRLSNNHTVKDGKGKDKRLHDICDELAGQYPPDFKFTGWHPQCRCMAVPLTASYADIREYYRRKRAGEDMTGYEVAGLVKHPPKAFTQWVTANSKRLQASAAAGRLPYFVTNNPKYAGIDNAPGTPKTDPVVPTPAKTEAAIPDIQKGNPAQTEHLPAMNKDEAIKQIQRDTGCSPTKAQEYWHAVRKYTGDHYSDIRKVQNGDTNFKPEHNLTIGQIQKAAKDLEEYIAHAPKWSGGATYRGMALSPSELKNLLNDLAKGKGNNFGSASWSTDIAVTTDFIEDNLGTVSTRFPTENRNQKVILAIKKQKNATSVAHISRSPSEMEVLASANNRYKFIGETTQNIEGNDYRVIEVEAM